MTGIVYHKIQRTGWHQVHHTYLIDVGTAIDVPLMEVSKLYESCILDPPYPKSRYFEVEIDEQRQGKTRNAIFHNILPVRAQKKPDWHFLIFRIRRGGWTVTERIRFPTDTGEAQWLYTDDFNILFLSSGGRHDLDMLTSLITGKLLAIAESIGEGNRIPSEYENQLSCRDAIGNLFSDGVDGAFREAVIYQDYGQIVTNPYEKDLPAPSAAGICSRHDRMVISMEKAAGLHINIGEIEELRDLSWLSN